LGLPVPATAKSPPSALWWAELSPIYIVARIAAATSVGMELDLQMRQALADIINKLRPEDTRH